MFQPLIFQGCNVQWTSDTCRICSSIFFGSQRFKSCYVEVKLQLFEWSYLYLYTVYKLGWQKKQHPNGHVFLATFLGGDFFASFDLHNQVILLPFFSRFYGPTCDSMGPPSLFTGETLVESPAGIVTLGHASADVRRMFFFEVWLTGKKGVGSAKRSSDQNPIWLVVSNIFIFTRTWGNDPIWLIFFRWVETTN